MSAHLTGHLEELEQMGTISTQPLPAFGLPRIGQTLFLNLVWLASSIQQYAQGITQITN
jgi:hypothetical protein